MERAKPPQAGEKMVVAGQPGGEIILYERDGGIPAIEVRLDGETVWLTQAQLADLFQTTPQNYVRSTVKGSRPKPQPVRITYKFGRKASGRIVVSCAATASMSSWPIWKENRL
ncbi:MAG: hypothetical protein LBH11_01700 [Propionibacteriaceae bacterium]|jgi:hypothetical protein|nr:hypothetical protein [Propionibacteriaceae bacterium]